MTRLYVTRDSCKNVSHNSFLMCDMTHYICESRHGPTARHHMHMCDMTHSYVWCDSFLMCDMTHNTCESRHGPTARHPRDRHTLARPEVRKKSQKRHIYMEKTLPKRPTLLAFEPEDCEIYQKRPIYTKRNSQSRVCPRVRTKDTRNKSKETYIYGKNPIKEAYFLACVPEVSETRQKRPIHMK